MMALDEAADHCDFAKCRLEQVRAFDPFDELLLEDFGGEQRIGDP